MIPNLLTATSRKVFR